ncbi:DUF7344 domain-containing protein [Haloarchaeobius litoreus]|uniref:ArsR family transcriptional regulator n=1 Tax=Haloarchaeobius litoreus TaxID=755306 RepID=A0ABD6DMX6_9EURY|nr:hypothetical protein [Haloarchaeobius litoreus]
MASQSTTGLNKTFDLLTHPSRRYVLYLLTTESEVMDIETLAAALANWDEGQSPVDESDNSASIEVALHHTHLPKLAEADLITYDVDTGIIELNGTKGHGQLIATAARVDGYKQASAGD